MVALPNAFTTHPGAETNAVFHPIANGSLSLPLYEGAQEAYVMLIAGGVPKRLSFENTSVNVLGWSAQGEVIVTMQKTKPAHHRPKCDRGNSYSVTAQNHFPLSLTPTKQRLTRMVRLCTSPALVHTRNDNVKQ